MPLALGTRTTTPPVTPVSPNDVPAAWWISPTGDRWELTNTALHYFTMQGVKGLGADPVTLTTDKKARGGSSLRHVQDEDRLITWPLFVEGDDHAGFVANWRALMGAFTVTKRLGPGTLVLARPDGTARQIQAYYQDGWVVSGADGSGVTWDTAALTLYCPDGYWQAPTPTLITRAYAPAGSSFLGPYPNVSSSLTLGETTVTNPGDAVAWPEWTITGPASQITAHSTTTGEEWILTPADAPGGADLTIDDTITVTTNPPAVTGPDGSNWVGALNWPGAVLWGLEPGDNDITFDVTGSNTGTSILAQFYARFESE